MNRLLQIIKITGLICASLSLRVNSQTAINPGEVNGIWIKQNSPYMIKGDINVPSGKTLIIMPGVKVIFRGHYLLNVQGSLIAAGSEKDTIVFTVADTTGFKSGDYKGWNGIRFDRRPVTWDTVAFYMPEDEEVKKIVQQLIENKEMDTATRINLVLDIPDVVKDTLIGDSLFLTKQSSRLAYCKFEYGMAFGKAQPYVFGGAIYIYRYSNLIISNCLFNNCRAYAGGAIYCKEAAPIINNNTIKNCLSESSGGAMVFIHSGPVVLNNTVKNNTSGYNGGAMLFYESTPFTTGNSIIKNTSAGNGGGIYCERELVSFLNTGVYVKQDTFRFKRDAGFEKLNTASLSLRNTTSSDGRFLNNVICDNKAGKGGGVGLEATVPDFINNTISNNSTDENGGGIYCSYSGPKITNTIIYGNKDKAGNSQVYLVGKSSPQFIYCDLETGLSGIQKDSTCTVSFNSSNILNTAPQYTNAATGDYSLTKGSGCIDAGMPDTASLKLTNLDFSGKSRIVNRQIDLGAIEYTQQASKTKSTEEQDEGGKEKDNGLSGAEEMFTSVYPNPSDGVITVAIHNNTFNKLTINVVSQRGNLVYRQIYETGIWFEEQIDLTGLAPGLYIVLISSEDTVLYNGEIVINNQ